MHRDAARTSRRDVWLGAAGILLAAYCIYRPALHGGWLWDDGEEIARNPVLRDPAGWWRIWFAPAGVDFFPLTTSLQGVLWHLGGARPAAFHLAGIVLHGMSGILFWRLLDRLGLRFAWWAGLLFVCHPLAVESVAWVSELKNTLSLPLLLLAMIAYVDFDATGSARCYAGSLLGFLLAMLAKSSVVMFPTVILLYAVVRRGRLGRRDVAASLPFFAVALLLGLVTVVFQHARAMDDWAVPDASAPARLRGAGLDLAFYFSKCALPFGLRPIYPAWRFAPSAFWQWLPWPVLAAGFAWLWRRRATGGGPALLGLGFFVLNLVPVLGFIPMAYLRFAPVADHFAYIALLGVVGLAAAGAAAAAKRARSWGVRAGLVGLGALITFGLAARSRAYAGWFTSEETLWTQTLRRDPRLWMARKNLAFAEASAGRSGDAIADYEAALALHPDFPEARNNLGTLLAARGDLAGATAQFREALRADPRYVRAHHNLGLALARTGDLAGAVAEYAIVLRLAPDLAEARADLGQALAELGQLPEAVGQLEEALRLEPGLAAARANLGTALLHLGRLDEARAAFAADVRRRPGSAAARNRLGIALAALGRLAEAREQFAEALRLDPADAQARANLARVERALGAR
jgi:tetratricopeptide (TPR) repeat protein